MLGDRNRFGKGVFYDAVTKVPMWLKPPKDTGFTQGIIEGISENYCIAPSILDYAGIDIPDTMSAQSLRRVIETGKSDHESVLCEFVTNDRSRRGRCIITDAFNPVPTSLIFDVRYPNCSSNA